MSKSDDINADFIIPGHNTIKSIFFLSEKLEDREYTPIQQVIRQLCINARKIYDKLEEKPELLSKIEKTLPSYMEKSENTVKIIYNSLLTYEKQKKDEQLSENQHNELLKKSELLVNSLNKSLEKLLNGLFSEEIMDLQAEMKLLDNMIMADGLFEIE